MRLHFRCTPGKLDLGLDLVLAQVLLCEVHHLGGDAFAFQILYRLDAGMFRNRQNPARGLSRGFAEKELAYLMHVGAVLDNPIVASDAAIEIPMLDVAADFLRANHANHELLVVHVGNVRAAADGNVVTGLGHLFDGGLLQAAFGQTKFQFLVHSTFDHRDAET